MSLSSIKAGLQACDQAWLSRAAALQNWRGEVWGKGSQDHSLFNTVVTPNSTQHSWNSCPQSNIGKSAFNNSSSYHPGGVDVLFADGSVRFIRDLIGQQTWWALGTKDSGEVVSSDSY